MAVKRKSVLDLEEIVNERQRAVAYIVSGYAQKLHMTNRDLAGASGLSTSTIANIFRKTARSMPGPKVLLSLAFGLTKGPYGQINNKRAKQLYEELMQAAGYSIDDAPFLDQHNTIVDQDASGVAIIKERIMAKLLEMPFQKVIKPISTSDQTFYDLVIRVKNCPHLDEWKFMILLHPQIPAACTTRFLMGLLAVGYKSTGKYSIVTDSEEIYNILSEYEWSWMGLYVSVILVTEDGNMSEQYIVTGKPYEELEQIGLMF